MKMKKYQINQNMRIKIILLLIRNKLRIGKRKLIKRKIKRAKIMMM
jgi:hypothetical protein